MALDLIGIQNLEFYSGHYLQSVLEGDLKSTFKKWADEAEEPGTRQPHEALKGLSESWFQLQARSDGERDAVERWRLARDFHIRLIQALGYEYERSVELLETGETVPTLLSLRRDGNPFLWIVDAPAPEADDDDPLDSKPLPEQLPPDADESALAKQTWRELLSGPVFRQERPPRWVLSWADATPS